MTEDTSTEDGDDGGVHVVADAQPAEFNLKGLGIGGETYIEDILFDDDGNMYAPHQVEANLTDRGVRFFTIDGERKMNDTDADIGDGFNAIHYIDCAVKQMHPDEYIEMMMDEARQEDE